MTSPCAGSETVLAAYVDGELTSVDREAFEAHLRTCQRCSEASRFQARFKAAIRGHLPRPSLPVGLRSRIEIALAAAPAPRRRWLWQAHPRAFTIGVAAAAAVLLLVVNTQRAARSPVVEQALSTFHHDLPLDVLSDSCSKVSDWFRGKVDFSLRPGAGHGATRCQGGRLVNVRDRIGAYVAYQAPGGHRLGVTVAPSDTVPLAGARQRVLRGRRAFVDTHRGVATVTFREPGGLDYVFTADLDEDALANWVETVYLSHP
ncbi:MAG: zf-HC2 domain-containing protein [Deltaproteobacteria bacterium]|nr:zf-HC2 domain-containing protein [Deltaproteobacteria bacterium]